MKHMLLDRLRLVIPMRWNCNRKVSGPSFSTGPADAVHRAERGVRSMGDRRTLDQTEAVRGAGFEMLRTQLERHTIVHRLEAQGVGSADVSIAGPRRRSERNR